MKQLSEALIGTAATTVSNSNTADTVGSGALPVFATPAMIALMEEATCNACTSLLDEGETTVGTSINVVHSKASGIGESVKASAALEEIDGRKLVFSVEATDSKGDIIGKGTVERFVVISERFMNKVEVSK